MSIIIDLILIGIIAISTFLGYKKGLIGVAFKIISFIIAIVITLILFKPISSIIINKTKIASTIEETINEKLSSIQITGGKIEEDTNLPKVLVNYINDEASQMINQTGETIINTVSKNLTETAINVIVMIVIFIITRLLLIFAKAVLETVAELPIVKQFNEVGGVLYGLLRSLLIIYVVLALISLIIPVLNNTSILESINNTYITKMLYNNNLILMIFF